MDEGLIAVTVVDLITAVSDSLRAGRPAGQVICAVLTRACGADSAAWIALREGEEAELVWGHPTASDAERLLTVALSGAEGLAPGTIRRVRGSRGSELVVIAPAGLPGVVPSDALRLLALSKRRGFTDADLRLLAEAMPALTLMLTQVVSASERARQARAQVSAARSLGMSERELEVLQLLAQGLLATSIASRLALSPRTVHKHLGNIYSKLGVHDRLVAVQVALRTGLVSADMVASAASR